MATAVALVSSLIVAVLLAAIGWMAVRWEDDYDVDELGARPVSPVP